MISFVKVVFEPVGEHSAHPVIESQLPREENRVLHFSRGSTSLDLEKVPYWTQVHFNQIKDPSKYIQLYTRLSRKIAKTCKNLISTLCEPALKGVGFLMLDIGRGFRPCHGWVSPRATENVLIENKILTFGAVDLCGVTLDT